MDNKSSVSNDCLSLSFDKSNILNCSNLLLDELYQIILASGNLANLAKFTKCFYNLLLCSHKEIKVITIIWLLYHEALVFFDLIMTMENGHPIAYVIINVHLNSFKCAANFTKR